MSNLIKFIRHLIIILFMLNFSLNVKSESLTGMGIKSVNYISNCKLEKKYILCNNFDKNSRVNVKILSDPYRIILDFDRKINFNNFISNKINSNLITKVRFNKESDLDSKLVLELSKPAIISELFYEKIDSIKGFVNLYINVTEASIASFALAKHALLKKNGDILAMVDEVKYFSPNTTILPKTRPKNLKLEKVFTVFIDPGHGGKDPGAIGTLGTLEKNLTLKASYLLAKELKKNKRINSVLSRKTDIYLSLRERTKLAKFNKSDVFISIHADASNNKNANGISVFSLSDRASDKEAQLLAKRENQVDELLGIKNKIRDPIIFGTLIKMFQREAMNDSSFLAKNIISNLKKTKFPVTRGHRFAGFAVLKSFDIPSILIEIGFLSNRQEETKMLNQIYLKNLSQSLSLAIEKYLFDQK